MTTVAFISSRKELEFLKKTKDFSALCLIALTPEADCALDEYFVQKKTIEDYYSEVDLNILGNASFEHVKEICDHLDPHCIAGNDFFSCHDVYWFIKILYDQILINHTFCTGVFEKENPKKVLLFGLPQLAATIFSNRNDDLMLHCIYFFFHCKKQVKCEILPSMHENSASLKNNKTHFFSLIQSSLSRWRFQLISQLYRWRNIEKQAIHILQHYDFEVCKDLRKDFKTYWGPQQFLKKKHDKNTHIKSSFSHLEEKNIFAFGSISYDELLGPKLIFLTQTLPPIFQHLVTSYRSFYVRKKIQVVISAAGQSLDILAGVKAARMENIAVVWGQHGGFYGYAEFPHINYLHKHYTHYFLYTEAISIINHHHNCFTVGDTKLLKLYQKKRYVN